MDESLTIKNENNMAHRTEAKQYNVYAVYNNGEDMETFIIRTLLSEVPPLITGPDNTAATYLEGWRAGAEALTHMEIDFVFEEVK